MTDMPRYQGDKRMPEASSKVTAPTTVMTAVKLMYVGAVLSVITLIVGLADTSGLRAAIRKAVPQDTATQVSNAVHIGEISIVVGGVIGVAVWIWMATANRRGRNWARITGTVFFGLDTIGLILGFAQHETAVSVVLAVLVWLVGLGAVIFLWQRASTSYFKAPKFAE